MLVQGDGIGVGLTSQDKSGSEAQSSNNLTNRKQNCPVSSHGFLHLCLAFVSL